MIQEYLKNSLVLSVFLFILIGLVSCSASALTAPPTQEIRSGATVTPSVMPCTVLHAPVTPAALGADFGERAHTSGPIGAPVTIVVFSDYQCPACAFLAVSLKQIRLTHPEDVHLVYVNTPLSNRDKDLMATQAVESADLQGKFWDMHDLLYEKQAEWLNISSVDFYTWVKQQATALGMDVEKFQEDFNGKAVADRLQKIMQSSSSQTVVPPILFVNSTSRYTGLADFPSLDTVVRIQALASRQFSECPVWIINPQKQYIATLHTAKGDVIIQLFPEKAPEAVNNFVFLTRKGWYDGITFYKVLQDSLIMTGDPSETGIGNPGYLFQTEASPGLQFDQPGVVAMDNSGPDTNGSRFLITLTPSAKLNGTYTIIGKVLTGMDVLNALSLRDPKPGIYLPPGDKLISVTAEER